MRCLTSPAVRDLDPTEVAFCDHILEAVSRTFALSIRRLPQPLSGAVQTAYLLCRIVDTVEDDRAVTASVRRALFDAFDAAVVGADASDLGPARAFEALAVSSPLGSGSERALALNATVVFRAFGALTEAERRAILPRILEMSRGMREYSARADTDGTLRIQDLQDLERYCHFVAGTVGELLTDLFALGCPLAPARRAALGERAARFGLGLQLVNVLKDVAEDAARGDCFLPLSCAKEYGVSIARMFEPFERTAALRLCRFLSARAREHLEAAAEYTLLWPEDDAGATARLFCAGPLALALGTLRQIELGTDAFMRHSAPGVSRDFVVSVFSELETAAKNGVTEAALRALFERARLGIADRPSRPPEPSEHECPPRRPAISARSPRGFEIRSEP